MSDEEQDTETNEPEPEVKKSIIDGEPFYDGELEPEEFFHNGYVPDTYQSLWGLNAHARQERIHVSSWFHGEVAYCHKCKTRRQTDYFLSYILGTHTIFCWDCCMELADWLGRAFRGDNCCPVCGFETNSFGPGSINTCIFGHCWKEVKEIHKVPYEQDELHKSWMSMTGRNEKDCPCINCKKDAEERRIEREREKKFGKKKKFKPVGGD